METLVPGRRLRARLLLLPLLLCFGPDTAGSISLDTLKQIVDYVHPKYKPEKTDQYAVAITLPRSMCQSASPSDLQEHLQVDLDAMKLKLKDAFLYEGRHIVAAKPTRPTKPDQRDQYSQHAEWQMFSLDQNRVSPVSRLLDKTREQVACQETEALEENFGSNRYTVWFPNNKCTWNGCFVFFSFFSPCLRTCLSLKSDHRIPQLMDGIFGAIHEEHRALAFKEVFKQDRSKGKQFTWNSWQTLCRVPMYLCDDQGCHSCAEKDVNKNLCLEQVKDPPKPNLAGKR
nr:uncharacterized protein LOC112544376 [Pelodiscus sinensis]|eukprot:XP_025036247.1 uncharacterized protein LOC112544376 [Pelodiscus sinensis]